MSHCSEIKRHTDSLNQRITARYMILTGYLTKIIMLETGLTYRQVLSIHQALKKEGYKPNRQSRTFRSSATLIHSRASKIDASLLMQFYCNFCNEETSQAVNIGALNKAYSVYHSIRKEIPTLGKNIPFDISGAWRLAQELKSDEAMMEKCNVCECTYFTSVLQRTLVRCPFCKG